MFTLPRPIHSIRRTAKRLWLVGLVFSLMYTGTAFLKYDVQKNEAWIIGYDQMLQFAWAHSLFFDGDLDLTNQYGHIKHLRGYGRSEAVLGFLAQTPPTPRNLPSNYTAAGSGLASLPLMALARVAAAVYELATSIRVSSFSAIYPLAHLATQVLLVFIGLGAAWRILRPRYGSAIALFSIATVLLGTPLGYYTVISPGWSHMGGFFGCTLFLASVLAWEKEWRVSALDRNSFLPSLRRALAMGIWLGVTALMRNSDGLVFIVPIAIAIASAARFPYLRSTRSLLHALAALFVAAIGFVAGFLPQMLCWKALFGSHIVNSYAYIPTTYPGFDFLRLYPRYLPHILFGDRIGLFLWHPLTLLAVAGLLLSAVRGRSVAWGCLAGLAAIAWVNSTGDAYWHDYPFGHRCFVDFSIFFMIGVAEILRRLHAAQAKRVREKTRLPQATRLLRVLIVVLVLWNLYLVAAFRAGVQPGGKPWAGYRILTNWSGQNVQRLWRELPVLPELVYNVRKAKQRAFAGTGTGMPAELRPTPILFTLFTPLVEGE